MLKKLSLILLAVEVLIIATAWVVLFEATHHWQACHMATVGCGTGPVVDFIYDAGLIAGLLFVFTLPTTIILWFWVRRTRGDKAACLNRAIRRPVIKPAKPPRPTS